LNNKPNRFHHGFAWISLCITLAIHVTDEALTDFLSVYNPAVAAIRENLPQLPLPTFQFENWLAGLILAIIILLLLSPFVFKGAKWMIPVSYFFGGLMILNGLGHIAGSFYLGRFMPGVYSSPVLLAAAVYLLISTSRQKRISSSL
jgi:hypothetical protein